jgi:prepilin-type N-terminal cleavage/methylation domain-containing protein
MARAPGYSLAELLVVLALVSVLALAAIPVAAPSADKRLDAAAQEVINALRFARIEALRTRTFYGADFSVDPATGTRRVRVFRTDAAVPPNPVYDVRHPLDKNLYDNQLVSGSATAGVTISAGAFYYQSGGATPVARDWAAFDAAGTPEYYPDAANYSAYSAAPYVSAVTLTYQGKSVQVLLDPVTGRVTRN